MRGACDVVEAHWPKRGRHCDVAGLRQPKISPACDSASCARLGFRRRGRKFWARYRPRRRRDNAFKAPDRKASGDLIAVMTHFGLVGMESVAMAAPFGPLPLLRRKQKDFGEKNHRSALLAKVPHAKRVAVGCDPPARRASCPRRREPRCRGRCGRRWWRRWGRSQPCR